MEPEAQRSVIEALLLASAEPLSARRMASVLGDETSAKQVRDRVAELREAYARDERGFDIEEVAGGYQLRTRPEHAEFVQRLRPAPPLRLSRAALETLAIVAYRQPLTRAEIEDVRGVEAGPVVRSLIDRRLLRIAGHREVPGRPMLYATTPRFLEVFGLASLSDLPTLREIEDLLRERAGADPEAAEGEALATAGEGEDDDLATLAAADGAAPADSEAAGKPH